MSEFRIKADCVRYKTSRMRNRAFSCGFSQPGDHIGVLGRRNLKGAPPCTGTHATAHVTLGKDFVEQMQWWQDPSNQQARNVQQEHGQWSPLLLVRRVEFFASVVDQSHSAAPVTACRVHDAS